MRRLTWRSLLFVPGDQPALLDKAIRSGADAVIVDLEDSVAPQAKAQARAGISAAVETLARAGVGVVVRIEAGAAQADLNAAVINGVDAIMAPKVASASDLDGLARMIGSLETARGMAPGCVGLIALIESPAAVLALGQIVQAQRVVALALGSEDFALGLGAPPSEISLQTPCGLLALHAAAAGVAALGLPISVGEFRDIQRYEAAAQHGCAMGMTGALCIHPAQVKAVNAAFAPTAQAIARATALITKWDEAVGQGHSVMAFEGAMVDAPVVKAARDLLRRAEAYGLS